MSDKTSWEELRNDIKDSIEAIEKMSEEERKIWGKTPYLDGMIHGMKRVLTIMEGIENNG